MSTNRRGIPAARPHNWCASANGTRLSQATRAKTRFTRANQSLLAVIGLLTSIASTHLQAAAPRLSPMISALELSARVGTVGPSAALPFARPSPTSALHRQMYR